MQENGQVNRNEIISLTMGILSVLFFPLTGLILGFVGLTYSHRSFREIEETKEKGKNLAVVGHACSIVGIAMGLISISIVVGGLALFSFRTNIHQWL